MQQAVQNTSSPLERNITVSIPVDRIEAEIATRLKKLARTVKMQGFRPGHVPLKMVERHYGFQVRQEVVSDTVQKSFSEAVKSQNYRVAGYPRFQPVAAAQGASQVEFTATFEVYPEVVVGDLSKYEVTRPQTDVSDGDVALGGPTSAATATNANDKQPSAATTRQPLPGFRTMILILSSRNDLDSDIAATAPMNADCR